MFKNVVEIGSDVRACASGVSTAPFYGYRNQELIKPCSYCVQLAVPFALTKALANGFRHWRLPKTIAAGYAQGNYKRPAAMDMANGARRSDSRGQLPAAMNCSWHLLWGCVVGWWWLLAHHSGRLGQGEHPLLHEGAEVRGERVHRWVVEDRSCLEGASGGEMGRHEPRVPFRIFSRVPNRKPTQTNE